MWHNLLKCLHFLCLKDEFERLKLCVTLCLAQEWETHCKAEIWVSFLDKKAKLPAQVPFWNKRNSSQRSLHDRSWLARQPEADLVSVCPIPSPPFRCTAKPGCVPETTVPKASSGKHNLPPSPESLHILFYVGAKIH